MKVYLDKNRYNRSLTESAHIKNMAATIGMIITAILLSSCAAIFNSKTQNVSIYTDDEDDVLFVNGSDETNDNGTYSLNRDAKLVQVVVENENYRDEQFVIVQYKTSPLYFLSWIPGIIVLAPAFDVHPSSKYDYSSDIHLEYEKIPELKKETDNAKNLLVTEVTTKLSNKNIRWVNHKYSDWVNDPDGGTPNRSNSDQTFTFTDLFVNQLNNLLVEKELANKGLFGSKSNTLYLAGHLESLTMHYVTTSVSYNAIAYADLEMSWNLTDANDEVIYSKKYNVTTGQFIAEAQFLYNPYAPYNQMLTKILSDGIEKSLYLFVNNSKVKSEIYQGNKAAASSANSKAVSSAKPKTASSANAKSSIKLSSSKNYVSSVKQAMASSVTIKSKNGHGSGFIISENGYIVTNYHVVAGAAKAKVVLNNNKEYDFDVIKFDKESDLALLKIDTKNLLPFKIQKSKEISVASDIYVIGTPASKSLAQTISRGIVSGVRDIDEERKLIQIDASVNSGNSGGAIIDQKGVVIGVVISKLMGFGVEGVAFGIPAYEIFDKLNIVAGY